MTITIAVAGRIATATATTQVVAGNTYPVAVSLDSEWTGNLFMRVRFGSLYYDIPFASTDTAANVQFPVGYPEVGIGIFSEALQVCTNEVRVRLLRSILEAGEQVVEFDGDLYDQWEGEVTTLLTDEAFDATSTRPVQNAVITAWKGTVALDASVVHNTGNETIAGEKALLTAPVVSASESGIIFLSDRSESSNQRITTLKFADATNPRNDPLSQLAVGRTAQYNYVISYLKKGTTSHSVTFRAHADHMDVAVTPYYPVDGSGNPQALTANALVASGNLAVDPRLVHTTGNEMVAGTKTFTNGIDAYPQNWHDVNKNGQAMDQYCIFATIPASTGVSGKFVQVDFVQSSNGGCVDGRLMFKVRLDGPDAMWVYRKSKGGNTNINEDAIHIVSDGTNLYLVSKRVSTYGMLKCRVGLFIDYGTVQSVNTGVTFHPQADMTVLDSLDGYTDLGIQEP